MDNTWNTKQIFADALRKLCAKKAYAKITVGDITQVSGFNRQSFYYHFKDKKDLLLYCYKQDANLVFDEHLTFENWDHYLCSLLTLMEEHKTFYRNSVSDEEDVCKTFLFEWSNQLFLQAISALDTHQELTASDKSYYSEFFSFAISGSIIQWILGDMKPSPKSISHLLKGLVAHSEHAAFAHYLQEHKGASKQ